MARVLRMRIGPQRRRPGQWFVAPGTSRSHGIVERTARQSLDLVSLRPDLSRRRTVGSKADRISAGFAVPTRLQRRVDHDFAAPGSSASVRKMLVALVVDLAGDNLRGPAAASWHAWGERVCTAVTVLAAGDVGRLRNAIESARTDWRDLLVAADLADDSWPAQLDRMLGPRTNTPEQ
jgi:hypothetical protein